MTLGCAVPQGDWATSLSSFKECFYCCFILKPSSSMCYANIVCWERLSFWCELLIIFISANRGNFERCPQSSSFSRSLLTLNSACLTASVCWMVWKQNFMFWMWRMWTLMSYRPTWTSVWWGHWVVNVSSGFSRRWYGFIQRLCTWFVQ